MTQAFSIMYHDVTARPEESGFPGGWADYYKIDPSEFVEHLEAIASHIRRSCGGLVTSSWQDGDVFITFDDGGASSLEAARLLEARGWRGHFFVPTNFIGKPGFLSADAVAELSARGHCIGSHSASHPARFSSCSDAELDAEWQGSLRLLEDLVGQKVVTASVPGGYYSRRAGRAAARAGVKFLFTSEPTSRIESEDGCAVLGRYYVRRGTRASAVASFAGGPPWARVSQSAGWKFRKLVKAATGPLYLKVAGRIRGQ